MLWNNNSKFQELYYQTLINVYRTYPVQTSTDLRRINLELEKVYVLPDLISKPPHQVSPWIVHRSESSSSLCIWDVLAQSEQDSDYRKILLLGGPGTGKTLLLEYLTLVYAQGNQRQVQEKVPKFIPILLYLRQIRKLILSDISLTLPEIIAKLIKRESSLKLDASSEWFEQKLNQGKCLVMFDGLDDIINPDERRTIGDWLDEQLQVYSANFYIISSRPYGYLRCPLKTKIICLELQTYNEEQTTIFLQNFSQSEQYNQLLNKIIKHVPNLNFLASSPLLLTFIAVFAQNPTLICQKRLELYREICTLLLTSRPKAKGVPSLYKLNSTEVQSILQKLALELMRRQQTHFTLEEGVEIISEPFKALVEVQQAPAQFLRYIEDITGLIQKASTKLYQFMHLSLQQYLAVAEIKQTNQEQILIDQINQPWWSETIRLYSTCSDTSKIIVAAWNQRSVLTMTLAYQCWQEGQKVNPRLKQRLENWLDAALESRDPEMARLAAHVYLSRRLKHAVAAD